VGTPAGPVDSKPLTSSVSVRFETYGRKIGKQWMKSYATLEQVDQFVTFIGADVEGFRERLRSPTGSALAVQLFLTISGLASPQWYRVDPFWSNAVSSPGPLENPDFLGGFVAGAVSSWGETLARVAESAASIARSLGTERTVPPRSSLPLASASATDVPILLSPDRSH
jgi:hypothetical protein